MQNWLGSSVKLMLCVPGIFNRQNIRQNKPCTFLKEHDKIFKIRRERVTIQKTTFAGFAKSPTFAEVPYQIFAVTRFPNQRSANVTSCLDFFL